MCACRRNGTFADTFNMFDDPQCFLALIPGTRGLLAPRQQESLGPWRERGPSALFLSSAFQTQEGEDSEAPRGVRFCSGSRAPDRRQRRPWLPLGHHSGRSKLLGASLSPPG